MSRLHSVFQARTPGQVARWLRDNEHHSGAASGDGGGGLRLSGKTAALIIPAELCAGGWFRASNFDRTGRMFEPTEAGLAAIVAEGLE